MARRIGELAPTRVRNIRVMLPPGLTDASRPGTSASSRSKRLSPATTPRSKRPVTTTRSGWFGILPVGRLTAELSSPTVAAQPCEQGRDALEHCGFQQETLEIGIVGKARVGPVRKVEQCVLQIDLMVERVEII